MEDSIRVLIADDHPLFRDGMRGLLGSLPDMEVVGEASSGEQAMELARELQPDVILMDIKRSGGGARDKGRGQRRGDLRSRGCPAPHKLLQRPESCRVAARLPGAYRARRRDPLPGRPGQDQPTDSQRAVCEPEDCS